MDSSEHLNWKRLGKKTVYKGRVHIVEYSVELPNGDASKYEVDESLVGAAAVLIKTDNDEIVLCYQYRFPLDAWIYDLPGGAVGEGETPEQAAMRECQEEVGVLPKTMTKLATFYPNPARTNYPAHIFFCEDFGDSQLSLDDPSENIEKIKMPIKELKELIDTQQIVDPMLLVAWYVARDRGYIKI